MDDKDRTLKALEDMKESMAYAVRRRATADVVTLEAQVLTLAAQRDDLAEALRQLLERHCQLVESGDCGNWEVETEIEVVGAREALRKFDHTARETSTVAQDK